LFTAGLIEVDGRNVHIASVSQLRSRAGGA
jgi:hypothetical protein